jgi:hypothetical protein
VTTNRHSSMYPPKSHPAGQKHAEEVLDSGEHRIEPMLVVEGEPIPQVPYNPAAIPLPFKTNETNIVPLQGHSAPLTPVPIDIRGAINARRVELSPEQDALIDAADAAAGPRERLTPIPPDFSAPERFVARGLFVVAAILRRLEHLAHRLRSHPR